MAKPTADELRAQTIYDQWMLEHQDQIDQKKNEIFEGLEEEHFTDDVGGLPLQYEKFTGPLWKVRLGFASYLRIGINTVEQIRLMMDEELKAGQEPWGGHSRLWHRWMYFYGSAGKCGLYAVQKILTPPPGPAPVDPDELLTVMRKAVSHLERPDKVRAPGKPGRKAWTKQEADFANQRRPGKTWKEIAAEWNKQTGQKRTYEQIRESHRRWYPSEPEF